MTATDAKAVALYFTASTVGGTIHEFLSYELRNPIELDGLRKYENETHGGGRRRRRQQEARHNNQPLVSVWPENREYWPPPKNRTAPPPPLPPIGVRASLTEYVQRVWRGNAPLHPLIEIDVWSRPDAMVGLNKFPHLQFWCSYVYTIDCFSTALIAASYCVSRLLPARWISIIDAAFGVNAGTTRLRNSATRFSHFFAPPSAVELVEIIEVHREYVRATKETVEQTVEKYRILFDMCGAAANTVFGGTLKNHQYRLVLSFPLICASGLSIVEFFSFLAKTQIPPRKTCIRLALLLTAFEVDRLTDADFGYIYRQFSDPPNKYEWGGLAGK